MSLRTVHAHFDGQRIHLDEPCDLPPNARLLVTILQEGHAENEQEAWGRLAAKSLANAYGEDEAEYPLDLIRELNPEYEGR